MAAFAPSFGVAFDVDGVLMKGTTVIPGAPEVLEQLNTTYSSPVPHVFLTNGGGYLENEKAEKLTKALHHDVPADRVVVAHTPMKALVEKYGSARVLGVGKEKTRLVLETYGFTNVVTLDEYVLQNPVLWPHCPSVKKLLREENITLTPEITAEPIDIILVVQDPYDWSLGMQILADVLASDGVPGNLVDSQVVPIAFANPDFSYGDVFSMPRITCGAFRAAVELVLTRFTGWECMDTILYGKPEPLSFEYAAGVLAGQVGEGGSGKLERVYMIGDNPASDIAGGNARGWVTILVRTGVYRDVEGSEPPQPILTPTVIVDDVIAAWEWIKEQERIASETNERAAL